MSMLWKWIDGSDFSENTKRKLFLLLNCLICSILGLLVWLFVRRFSLNTWDIAFCFVGYPGFFIGFIGGFLFLCRR